MKSRLSTIEVCYDEVFKNFSMNRMKKSNHVFVTTTHWLKKREIYWCRSELSNFIRKCSTEMMNIIDISKVHILELTYLE